MSAPAIEVGTKLPELPIIMFTGRGGEDIAVELMKAGVADYIPKASISAERLAAGDRRQDRVDRRARPASRLNLRLHL